MQSEKGKPYQRINPEIMAIMDVGSERKYLRGG